MKSQLDWDDDDDRYPTGAAVAWSMLFLLAFACIAAIVIIARL